MPPISGRGGTVMFTPYGLTTESIDISTWELDSTASKVAVTPAGVSAGQRFLPEQVCHTWKLTTPLDDTQYPGTLNITEGESLFTMFFALGTAASSSFQLYDKLTESFVESVSVVEDVNGAIQLSISGSGGSITRGVTG